MKHGVTWRECQWMTAVVDPNSECRRLVKKMKSETGLSGGRLIAIAIRAFAVSKEYEELRNAINIGGET